MFLLPRSCQISRLRTYRLCADCQCFRRSAADNDRSDAREAFPSARSVYVSPKKLRITVFPVSRAVACIIENASEQGSCASSTRWAVARILQIFAFASISELRFQRFVGSDFTSP